MRLDKYLAEVGLGTRSEVKKMIKKGQVRVAGQVVKDVGLAIEETTTEVSYLGEVLHYQKYFYYLLHKPAGVITATKDRQKTVLDLVPEPLRRADLFPVGRLDKDTEGLLILTNDGPLAHDLLSPKKHVEKEYFAKIAGVVTQDTVRQFANGITLDGAEEVSPSALTIVAVDEQDATSEILLVIHEGKYHQVKRMFEAVQMKVTYLKRVRMASLTLGDLKLGELRALTTTEIKALTDR